MKLTRKFAAALALLALGATPALAGSLNPVSTLQLPATTTAYSSGQLVATSATAGSVVVPSVALPNGTQAGLWPALRLTTNDNTSTSWGGVGVQVDLWSCAPTVTNGDRGAFAIATGAACHVRSYTGTFSAMAGDGAYAELGPSVSTVAVPPPSGAAFYWTLQTTAASGVTGASKVMTLTAEIIQ